MNYIKNMTGFIKKNPCFGADLDSFIFEVYVSTDAKQFNLIKKKSCPLQHCMAQIKNVVFDKTNIRGTPSYAPVGYKQRWPRAKNGLIVLKLTFDISHAKALNLGADLKDFCLYKQVDLNTTLNNTRLNGHLFAKTAMAQVMGH
jgi:hypothetical protein